MIRMFIGYDRDIPVIYHALCHSVIRHSSEPVSFTPIARHHVSDVYTKPISDMEATEFSMTRFLTPYLSNYEGWSIFTDNDMIVTADIAELWALRDDKYAVMCTKHDYTVSTATKFLNRKQTAYQKKNWSSVMMFNNARCKALTPDVVNTESGLFLHQFKWLEDDSLIGDIPLEWNFLVDEIAKPETIPKLIHYTLGGPYFNDYMDTQYASEWLKEYKLMNNAAQVKN